MKYLVSIRNIIFGTQKVFESKIWFCKLLSSMMPAKTPVASSINSLTTHRIEGTNFLVLYECFSCPDPSSWKRFVISKFSKNIIYCEWVMTRSYHKIFLYKYLVWQNVCMHFNHEQDKAVMFSLVEIFTKLKPLLQYLQHNATTTRKLKRRWPWIGIIPTLSVYL